MSPIGLDETLLWGIVVGSFILALASLLVLGGLMIRRSRDEQKAIAEAALKKTIAQCLYAAVRSPIALTRESLPLLKRNEHEIAIRVALDVLRFVRGADVKKVVSTLRLWDLDATLLEISNSSRRIRKGLRIQALTLLGFFEDEDSLAALLAHGKNREPYVQLAALRGLAERQATEHIGVIVDILAQSGQTNMPMLADILTRFGGNAANELLRLSGSQAPLEIRLAALSALGSLRDLNSVSGLMGLCDSPDAEIRARAIEALGNIGDARASGKLVARLSESDPAIRVQAAKALGKIREMSTLPTLVECMEDADWWVRYRCGVALVGFGDPGQAVLRSLSSRSSPGGAMAKDVLAELESR